MNSINIKTGKTVLQTQYEYNDGTYEFPDDFVIGSWTVKRLIQLKGPKSSVYKYDFKNCLEFVISDKHGEEKIIRWYHNSGDELLRGHISDESSVECLSFFFCNHPIFKSIDWEDANSTVQVQKIRELLKDNENESYVIIDDIKHILETDYI